MKVLALLVIATLVAVQATVLLVMPAANAALVMATAISGYCLAMTTTTTMTMTTMTVAAVVAGKKNAPIVQVQVNVENSESWELMAAGEMANAGTV